MKNAQRRRRRLYAVNWYLEIDILHCNCNAGMKNAQKATPLATERAAEELARRALKLGFANVIVRLKGAAARQFAFKIVFAMVF